MKLNIKIPLIFSACLACTSVASADTITWTGNGNAVSLYETNNWDNPGGVITVPNFKSVPVAHDFVVKSSTDTVGGGGGVGGVLDLGGTGSLTVTDPNGGTAGGELRLGAGAILKNGTISVSGSNFNYIQGTLDNADFWSNWGLTLRCSLDILNGSSVEATWFANGGTSDIGGASTLTIREDGAGSFNGTTLNFLDFDSTIVYSNTNRTIAEVSSQHLSSFTVDGEAAVVGDNVLIYTDSTTGFTTVQAIPEPQTLALLGGLLALTSVMLRRRTH